MSDNEKLKWLKPTLRLIIFSLACSAVYADNSTDYEDGLAEYILVRPAPEVIPECGVNEVYQSCEVSCIDCEGRGMCEAQNCDVNHCDCRMYFVHVTPGGPCEHVSVCPARECPENEVYRHCGPYCEYCDMAKCRSLECSSRCYCKAGYRRNRETGKCIPAIECPERLNCTSNDAVAESGPFSEHCLQTESEVLRTNETVEEEKCYCPSGFKRNVHGWCIEEDLCRFVTCLEQTEFQSCPRKCNTTCWNYGDPNCEEDGQCYPSCFCPEGYVLNEFFACIPVEMCPPGSNPFVPILPPPTVGPIPEPALHETSEASAVAATESSSAGSSSESGSSSAAAAAAESSSGTGSSSAAAAESSSGTGSSSAAAAESSSGKGSSSAAAAAESSSGKGSSSAAAAAESSSGKGSSSAAAAAESSSEADSSSAATGGSESAEGTEKAKEAETAETTQEDRTTEAPKKPPKKATGSGKIYKSAARPGKKVVEEDSD